MTETTHQLAQWTFTLRNMTQGTQLTTGPTFEKIKIKVTIQKISIIVLLNVTFLDYNQVAKAVLGKITCELI